MAGLGNSRGPLETLALAGLGAFALAADRADELSDEIATRLGLDTGFWAALRDLDFGTLGYAIVSLFILTWLVSAVVWKTGRIEQRWSSYIGD